ncbi:MAG: hypothetical protein JRN15_19840 [Nitrososphaerota archaeon]|nr:hypothetical protein [Nitrososphaerota archaeon]
MPSPKQCPLCGTKNDQKSKSCKNCGYVFIDDFGSSSVDTSSESNLASSPHEEQDLWKTNLSTPLPSTDTSPVSSASSSGAPLYVVSKPLLGSIAPVLLYIVLIFFLTGGTNFSILSIGIIAIFVVAAIFQVLVSTRKYEFYDDSLRMHKTIGGDSEVQYSQLEKYDYPVGRRPRLVLSAAGHRRPIVIPGNPSNGEQGVDLNQFLTKKLKKHESQFRNEQQPTPSSGQVSESNINDDSTKEA